MFIPGGKYKTQLNRYTTETVYKFGDFSLTEQRLTRAKNKSGSRCDQHASHVTSERKYGQAKALLFLSGIEPETFRV
jgi:hypothetical protein